MKLFKKKEKDDSLDILDNIKEPFSWEVFYDEKIVDPYKNFKKMLDERGITFFLTSPFQYRNRLVWKLWIIVIGIVVGIVPRTMHLIQETKQQNSMSEFANLGTKTTSMDNFTITPLASSQYNKQHIMVFNIKGDTSEGVPSSTGKYNVTLSPLRGVVDAASIEMRYEILPIDTKQRLLVVYTNHEKQNDETGIFNLYVELAGKEVQPGFRVPLEIVLSNTQQTSELFNENGIDLSVLSSHLMDIKDTPIQKAKDDLEAAYEVYDLTLDRLAAKHMGASVSLEDAKKMVEESLDLNYISDTSTIKDLPKDALVNTGESSTGRVETLQKEVSLIHDGKSYSLKSFKDEQNEALRNELQDLQSALNKVMSAAQSLRNAQKTRYNALVQLKANLKESMKLEDIKGKGTIEN